MKAERYLCNIHRLAGR